MLSEEEGYDGSYARRRYDVDGDDDDGQRSFLGVFNFFLGTVFYSPRDAFCYLTVAPLALAKETPLYFQLVASVLVDVAR